MNHIDKSMCKVVSKFRQMDLDSGGQGAPLAPIYHNQLSKIINNKFKLNYPMSIINIGRITNVSKILNDKNLEKNLFAYDIAPGNCSSATIGICTNIQSFFACFHHYGSVIHVELITWVHGPHV